MTPEFKIFKSRDNADKIQLIQDKYPIDHTSLTRVVFDFGLFVIDSDEHPSLFSFEADFVLFKLGSIVTLAVGAYTGSFIAYSGPFLNGINWGQIKLTVSN
jgi:hypothetical protein